MVRRIGSYLFSCLSLTSLSLFLVLPLSLRAASESGPRIHHALTVSVDPADHRITVRDSITISTGYGRHDLRFLLHRGMEQITSSDNVTITVDPSFDVTDRPVRAYLVASPPDAAGDKTSPWGFQVEYSGRIDHPLELLEAEYARGFSETIGTISDQGVFLAGSSYWIPTFGDTLLTFDLTVSLPLDWDAVSQGRRGEHTIKDRRLVSWHSLEPMEEIYLLAARFTEYSRRAGRVEVMAFLREPDQSLADNYLETTVSYLSMYEQLLGPFPYAKFALVENFWETGYGMPSFTLLGPKVIRFPFILHSSYPHELLHNWWGNGVYVGRDGGNWCEGLTVYLADHLIKEQRNQAVPYRRNTLQIFADFVNSDNDFPLAKFTRRTDSVTSSIGYNKAMMLWHMLRLELGDAVFVEGLKCFYRDNLYRRAGFQDLRQAFEAVSGQDLTPFFNQWLHRTGAAELAIIGVRVEEERSGFRLFFTLVQNQKEAPFRLTVPIAVTTADQHQAQIHRLEMNERRQDYSFSVQAKPLRLDVDPRFDLFRRLHNLEIPPALSRIFGAPEALILLPSQADPDMAKGYKNLAETWGGAEQGPIAIRLDSEVKNLPTDRPVWVFGQENIHRATVGQTLAPYGVVMSEDRIYMAGSEMMLEEHSLVAAGRNPSNPKQIVVWLHANRPAALNGLGRKLPHYRKYSYLAFEGDEPVNVMKGQWPAVNSPMSVSLVTSDGKEPTEFSDLRLPPEKALIEPTPVFSARAMMKHVEYLASSELEGRGLGSAGLDQAAQYIAARFEEAGLKPAADDSTFLQHWEAAAGPDENPTILKNVLAVLPGSNQDWEAQSVVICAHYDHLGRGWPDVHQGDEGKIHFGADDNASGIAVLLELATHMAKGAPLERNIVFAAFTGEEGGRLGSKYYVQNMRRFPAGNIVCAINLDTVGRLGESKILILNSSTASEWPHIFRGIGFVTGLEIDLSAQDLDSSDQASFIEKGIPAVQIFSGAHLDYHRPTDTPDKIDASGMVKIATATRELLVYLGARGEPLTTSLHPTTSTEDRSKPGGRRVSTGIMPDFVFAGEGVRIDAAAPDSPASKVGLTKGDIIIAVDDSPVASLKSYSDILKAKEAGDMIKVRFRRGDQEKTVSVTLAPR